MKKLLIGLLLVPVFSFGQSQESITAFLKSKPGGLGRTVSLPESDYYSFIDFPFYSRTNKQRSIIYVVSSDSVYHKLFSRYSNTKESLSKYKVTNNDSFYYKLHAKYLIDSLPVFDFSKQELVLYTACGQCLAFCHHDGGKNNSCHRNACHLMEAWHVRDKEPLLVKSTEKN